MTFGDVGFKSTVEALSKEVPCRFGFFVVVGGSPPPPLSGSSKSSAYLLKTQSLLTLAQNISVFQETGTAGNYGLILFYQIFLVSGFQQQIHHFLFLRIRKQTSC